MTKQKAIQKILKDIGLHSSYEDYVVQTIGKLGCDDNIDLETISAIKQVILNDLSK